MKSVSKKYSSGDSNQEVLKNVSLEINQAEFTVISGPSGSGKSTLLNLIGALDNPDSGEIKIDGIEINSLNDKEKAKLRNEKIGFIFQSFHLIPVLTACENVAWPLYLKGVSRKERMQKARELLSLIGLSSHMNKPPSQLSGGQKQRVAIARALICEPSIILADEPTANLDRSTGLEIMSLLTKLNNENRVTFIFSTHDDMVTSYAKRQLFLENGNLMEKSTESNKFKEACNA